MSRATGKLLLCWNIAILCNLPCPGAKRKFDSDTANSRSDMAENDDTLSGIDGDIDNAVLRVKDGTHLELQKRAESLRKAKENKMASADRHRKMQIKNINLLYEYELEDANALYNVSLKRTNVVSYGLV